MGILTKENIDQIELGYYDDPHYQDDGNIDFSIEVSNVLVDMFFSCKGTDRSKMLLSDEDYIDAYTCSEDVNGTKVFKEIEFVYHTIDDDSDWFTYELNEDEAALLTEKIKGLVKANWHMTLEEMFEDAKENDEFDDNDEEED